jgi:hypothetical protein
LHRFHSSSQALQSTKQDLDSAVAIYKSLLEFIRNVRTRFEEFETKGKALSECDQYKAEMQRVRRRNHHYNDLEAAPEQPQTPVDMFRIGTFVVIVDSIASELGKRLAAYAEIAAMFGFMRTLKNLSNEKLIECAIKLQKAYPTDLEDSLSDELLHFSSFLKTDFAEKWFEVSDVPTTPAVSSKEQSATSSDESDINEAGDDNNLLCVESIELRLIVVNNSTNMCEGLRAEHLTQAPHVVNPALTTGPRILHKSAPGSRNIVD